MSGYKTERQIEHTNNQRNRLYTKTQRQWTEGDIQSIKQLMESGKSMNHIGKIFNVSRQRIYQIAQQNGFKTNVQTRKKKFEGSPNEYKMHRRLVSNKSRLNKTDKYYKNDGSIEDLLPLPSHCPIFGIELNYKGGNNTVYDNSASIDRINPDLGYDRGNIHIISYKANRMKNNGTLEELEKIVNYFKI